MKYSVDASIFSDESGFFGLLSGSVTLSEPPLVGSMLRLLPLSHLANAALAIEHVLPGKGVIGDCLALADVNFETDALARQFVKEVLAQGLYVDLRGDLTT